MVEHISRNPAAVPILEADVRTPPVPHRGMCLICGSWLDLDGDQDGCSVTLVRGRSEVSEHVVHMRCLEQVAHASANLFGSRAAGVPENHLASKFLTPSGR